MKFSYFFLLFLARYRYILVLVLHFVLSWPCWPWNLFILLGNYLTVTSIENFRPGELFICSYAFRFPIYLLELFTFLRLKMRKTSTGKSDRHTRMLNEFTSSFSLCTDVPPPSGKIGRGDVVSSSDFFWGSGDVCTQATLVWDSCFVKQKNIETTTMMWFV